MEKGELRKKTKRHNSRNFYIITIGFICSLVVVIYGVQNMMMKMGEQKDVHPRVLHCEFDNKTEQPIPIKLTVGVVVLYEDTLLCGKTAYDYTWQFNGEQDVVAEYDEKQQSVIHGVSVSDSVSYLMMIISPSEENNTFEYSFFRN